MQTEFNDRFGTIWEGGYYEGNPADPMASSQYGIFGYHSSLYLTYRCCIKPFITGNTTILEIGPGRGAWTKTMADLRPRKIYAVDIVDPEYAGFNQYVGQRESVKHIVAQDFSLDGVPDNSIDLFFSFGCFCHLKPEMCISYINALARKMRANANGFLMIADYDKFNACVSDVSGRSIFRAFTHRRFAAVRAAFRLSLKLFRDKFVQRPLDKFEPDSTEAGAWFHFGAERACEALRNAGFRIIEADMGINHRDPVIHFVAQP
jgi:SAM-dependent methyltransferase